MQNFKQFLIISLLIFVGTSSSSFADDDFDEPTPYDNSEATTLSQAELEQLLSPIALYPDTILSHILVAATYPLEVVQAERWVTENEDLTGSDAVEAVQDFGWDPSVQALVAFPTVLKRMSEDLEWTQSLGEAFLADEAQVLAGVQSLRQLAAEAGTLDDMDKVTVSEEDEYITIEPIEREVVYVPYYDSRRVYGNWRWRHHAPIFWDYPYYDSYYAYDRYRPFYWGPRVSVSYGFFFNSFHWRNRCIVRIPARHYRSGRYYSHRQIANHRAAQRWQHNPQHRRGVTYRNAHLEKNFNQAVVNTRSNPARVRDRLITQRSQARDERALERDVRFRNQQRLRQNRVINQSRRATANAPTSVSRPSPQTRPNVNRPPRAAQPRTAVPRVTQPRVTQPRATQPRATQQRAPAPRARQAAPSAPQPAQRQARQQRATKQYNQARPKPARNPARPTTRSERRQPR